MRKKTNQTSIAWTPQWGRLHRAPKTASVTGVEGTAIVVVVVAEAPEEVTVGMAVMVDTGADAEEGSQQRVLGCE